MRITFLTGAGLSTAAGIPDFRGPEGVWTRDPLAERMSTLSWYLKSPEVRERAWQMRLESGIWAASPTEAHHRIAQAEKQVDVKAVVTQNTDGLHTLAGSNPDKVLEVHGSARRWQCEDCDATGPMEDQIRRVKDGEPDPSCPHCGGITRATTILFEEMLKTDVIEAAFEAAENCDWIIAIGTSLSVTPVAHMFPMAIEAGARGMILNAEPTPFDAYAEEVVRGDLQETVPRVLDELLS